MVNIRQQCEGLFAFIMIFHSVFENNDAGPRNKGRKEKKKKEKRKENVTIFSLHLL